MTTPRILLPNLHFYIGIHQTVTFMLVVREGQDQDHIFSTMYPVNHGHMELKLIYTVEWASSQSDYLCVLCHTIGKREEDPKFYSASSIIHGTNWKIRNINSAQNPTLQPHPHHWVTFHICGSRIASVSSNPDDKYQEHFQYKDGTLTLYHEEHYPVRADTPVKKEKEID